MSVTLAIDTSGPYCAAALTDQDKVLSTKTEVMTKGQAERLFPIIDDVLKEAGKSFHDLSAIAVAVGPGNFTGVRIGVSAARGLAMSLKRPAVGISCLDALSYGQIGKGLAILDARADHVYVQIFGDGSMSHTPVHILRQDLPSAFPDIDACVGYCAEEIAAELGANAVQELTPSVEIFGFISATRDLSAEPRPAPLYLRSPDAALPSEPAPFIIS